MRILVTGGCGLVGRHFVKRLLDDGHDVTCVDNMMSGVMPENWMFKPSSIKRQRMLFCDVRGFLQSANQNPMYACDLVIHCAAIVGGRLKIENDPLAVATDLSIDSELFDWAVRQRPMPKVVYFSSSAVYPNHFQKRDQHIPLYETIQHFHGDRVGLPDLTYGWAKLSGE